MRVVTFVLMAGITAVSATVPQAATGPLTVASGRISIEGTSNIHAYTAASTAVRLVSVEVDGVADGDVLTRAMQPGRLRAFEVVITAKSLKSPKDGIDGNMHKALKAAEHPDIRFQLRTLEPRGARYQAVGMLTIAGVEKEVTLDLEATRQEADLAVSGSVTLLMTDYGITPPKAMLGMLRTNPKVTIRFELVLAASS